MPKYAILAAPGALGVPEHLGVERAPDVLLRAGLADGLAARRAGRVAAEGYSPVRDPQTKIMNPRVQPSPPAGRSACRSRSTIPTSTLTGRTAVAWPPPSATRSSPASRP